MSKLILQGTVVKGRGVGKKLGVPTANIELDTRFKIPKFGVYACELFIKNIIYQAAVFIGPPLTFNLKRPVIEVTIIDFNDNIYGEHIELEIKNKIREIKKFDSVEELRQQILMDIMTVEDKLS